MLVFLLSLTELPGREFFAQGQLKRPGAVHLVLGNAQLNLHFYDKAVEVLEQAGKHKASAVNAKQWLNYARAEGERVKDLGEAGTKLEGLGAKH